MAFKNAKKIPALVLMSWRCRDIIATLKLLCRGLIIVLQHWLIVAEL